MLTLITPPASPVVSLDECKAHLRVDYADEDGLITALEAAAVSHIDGPDGYLGRALIEQTIKATFSGFPKNDGALQLPCPPLIEVTDVTYLDGDGAEISLAATDYRTVPSRTARAKIVPAVGAGWPAATDGPDTVAVTYKAGYGPQAADVPKAIHQAILLMVGNFYENREAVVTGTIVSELPLAVRALLGNYRIYF